MPITNVVSDIDDTQDMFKKMSYNFGAPPSGHAAADMQAYEEAGVCPTISTPLYSQVMLKTGEMMTGRFWATYGLWCGVIEFDEGDAREVTFCTDAVVYAIKAPASEQPKYVTQDDPGNVPETESGIDIKVGWGESKGGYNIDE